MSDKKITDLTAIPSVDRTTNVLPIVDVGGNVTYKVTPNNLLGFTGGNPVSTSDTQVITNKTLGNTNTITLKDTLFTLQDDSDTTKQAQFQLSGITTATTRTYTLPNASSTLVDLSTAQTLTNKILTSPTINTPTISNATITADSISGFSSANTGTIYGLAVSSGTISSAGLASNAVVTAGITDGAVTPNKLQATTGTTWAWQSWTPTWANFTVGNGTVTAKYLQIGKTVTVFLKFVAGSTSAFGTNPTFTAPVTAASQYSTQTNTLGIGYSEDLAIAGYSFGYMFAASTTIVSIYTMNVAATVLNFNPNINATTPWTLGAGDFFSVTFTYEAA